MPLFELLPERIAQPLLPGGMIEPEGVTILYGAPGSRKGVVAAWQAMELVNAGYRVAILDFEGRERQWRLRLRDIPHGMLYYYDAAEPIDIVQQDVEIEVLTSFEPHVLIIDSGSMAVPELRGMGEASSVRKLYRILKDWQRPALLLHHVSKADMRGSDALPLGTVQWYAQARLAINIDTMGAITSLHFRKANDRVEPQPIYCRWDWVQRRMYLEERKPEEGSIMQRGRLHETILVILREAGTPMTSHQINDELEKRGMRRGNISINSTLNAMYRLGKIERPGRMLYAASQSQLT